VPRQLSILRISVMRGVSVIRKFRITAADGKPQSSGAFGELPSTSLLQHGFWAVGFGFVALPALLADTTDGGG